MASFNRVVLMILDLNAEETIVAKADADEADIPVGSVFDLAEIDQHLLSGRSIEYVVIDPAVFGRGIDDLASRR